MGHGIDFHVDLFYQGIRESFTTFKRFQNIGDLMQSIGSFK